MKTPIRCAIVAVLACTSVGPAGAAPSASPRERIVKVETGVSIHLLDAGPVRGALPTLVLIPGWRTTAGIWRAQLEAFSRERRVLAIDPRGQGESTKAAEGNTPEQRARDLDAVLRTLDVGSAILVGWSQGAQDVAAYAEAFGLARVKGVVFVDAPVAAGAADIVRDPQLAKDELLMIAAYQRSARAWTDEAWKAIVLRPLPKAQHDHLVDEAMKTPSTIGAAMLVADSYGVDRTPVLAKLDRPALVIASSATPALAELKAMAERLPRGRLEVVAESGHAVFIDQPERFNTLLLEFLKGLD